ncbi:unnamed protein product, partial [Iphiclides podalirius]
MKLVTFVRSILIVTAIGCNGDRTVPVLLLDFDKSLSLLKVDSNPLVKLSSEHFVEITRDILNSSKAVIIFVEETLCAEDISTKDTNGSAYKHLREALTRGQVRYLPSVADPYAILKKTFNIQNTNVFQMSDAKVRIYDPQHKHYYVHFVDENKEKRIEALRRHDGIMREVYFSMRDATGGPVVAIYTGKRNPIVVKKLASAPLKRNSLSQDASVIVESNDALFRFSGVYSTSSSRHSRFSQIPIVAEERTSRRHLSTKVAYTDFDLQFNFTFKKDGWTIDDVALLEGGEEVGRAGVGGGAPWDWSYVCGEPLVVINTRDGSAVTISHYQIQPFKRAGRSYGDDPPSRKQDGEGPPPPAEEAPPPPPPPPPPEAPPAEAPPAEASPDKPKSFGKSVHCGPYFNSAILAGLMVTAVLLGILFVGIGAVYGCRANSRYDDAQGKPLVISTEGGH